MRRDHFRELLRVVDHGLVVVPVSIAESLKEPGKSGASVAVLRREVGAAVEGLERLRIQEAVQRPRVVVLEQPLATDDRRDAFEIVVGCGLRPRADWPGSCRTPGAVCPARRRPGPNPDGEESQRLAGHRGDQQRGDPANRARHRHSRGR